MRLDKFLAHAGFGSRKEVKQLVKDEMVMVNDSLVKKAAMHLDPEKDTVSVDGIVIPYLGTVYYMLHKPAGYICSHDNGLYPSVLELIEPYQEDLIMVGRLDVDTEGLLLITNDGQFSHRIAHGKKAVMKKYYVQLETEFDQRFIAELEAGITLEDEPLKPAIVEMIDEQSLYLSIAEGKYHQVKKMMHYCDNAVTYLKRVQIGNLTLDETLALGEYRRLREDEIALFD